MTILIPVLASIAVAGGVGSLVGVLIGGRAPKAESVPVERAGAAVLSTRGRGPRTMRERIAASLPAAYLRALEHQIVLAGRPSGWTVDKMFIAKPLLAAPVVLLGWLWVSADAVPLRIVVALGASLIAFFLPELLIYNRAVKRQGEIELALPDTLDQMTISVEAGLGFEGSMATVAANGKGPLAEELIRTLQDMSIGRSRRAAYDALTERTSSVDLRRFARAVIQADAYGISIADVLRVQAGEMRLKRRQRAEEKAMKVPVKVLFPLMFCILPVLFIVLLTPAAINTMAAFL